MTGLIKVSYAFLNSFNLNCKSANINFAVVCFEFNRMLIYTKFGIIENSDFNRNVCELVNEENYKYCVLDYSYNDKNMKYITTDTQLNFPMYEEVKTPVFIRSITEAKLSITSSSETCHIPPIPI